MSLISQTCKRSDPEALKFAVIDLHDNQSFKYPPLAPSPTKNKQKVGPTSKGKEPLVITFPLGVSVFKEPVSFLVKSDELLFPVDKSHLKSLGMPKAINARLAVAFHPFGQVPVFDDGVIKRFGEELVYWDARKQAIVANWIDVEDHKFEPPALRLINNPSKGLTSDQSVAAEAEAEAELGKVLDVYETRLSKFKYLASDDYTIADLVHLPNLEALLGNSYTKQHFFESRPHLSAWCFDILARPAWTKVLEMQKMAKPSSA
ncbi:hypothetical protein LWI28_025909 [Acer negundo]|uniref:glutathione transferase n=1 Tax=Acer negundo TaxID=4023 RepID=A0AAD5J1B2_ACENE|nr:hypothetical protein LWI28_025909 [Acer negundo]